MALPGDSIDLGHYSITGEQVENAILDYLRDYPGQMLSQWAIINRLCSHFDRSANRSERGFYLHQLMRLVRERKVIAYRKRPNRGKIRISEAYV